jgi:hypothetical protein
MSTPGWGRRAPTPATVGTAGALATIEDPATVRRLATLTGAAAVISTGGFAALFFGFDQPAAGWATLGLTLAYLLVWLAFLTGTLTGR